MNCPLTTPDVTEQLDPVIGVTRSAAQKIWQDASIKLKLVPATVTAEPVPPWSGLSVILGATMVKVSDAEPGITWAQGNTVAVSVNVIVYDVNTVG